MQAMPMINQPAPVNEAVAPRAARTASKGTDDKFLPALRDACNDCGDEFNRTGIGRLEVISKHSRRPHGIPNLGL